MNAQDEWQESGTEAWLEEAEDFLVRDKGLAHTHIHTLKKRNWQHTKKSKLNRFEQNLAFSKATTSRPFIIKQ